MLCHLPSVTCNFWKLPPRTSFTASDDRLHRWGGAHPGSPWRGLILVCAAKRTRVSRESKLSKPVMSDADLCDELRAFVASEGLPENRMPSMAELSKRGRKDLASIVRRKGYKLIAEFFRNQANEVSRSGRNLSANEDTSTSPSDKSIEFKGRGSDVSDDDVSLDKMDSYVNCRNGSILANSSIPTGQASDPVVRKPHTTTANKLQNEEFDKIKNPSNGNETRNSDLKYEIHALDDAKTGLSIPNKTASFKQEQNAIREYISLNEEKCRSDLNADTPSRADEVDDKTETNHLKALLHEKEMELMQLKQEIAKEKLALSTLHNEVNAKISNIHSEISAKDEELRAAEEALLGLKEVSIDYQGNGETVEITGSFNGWEHRIKMDHHPSCDTQGLPESREINLWTVTLWLYPGIYEVKFVVDGHWMIDPRRELATTGYITNNVIRVDT